MEKINKEIREIEKVEIEGAKVRTGAKYVEPQESPTAQFFKIERNERTIIESIKKTDGQEVTEINEILGEVRNFYKNLYKKVDTDANYRELFLNKIDRKLNAGQKGALEGLIEEREVLKAIKERKSGKSPGIDGLGKEFYVKFWDIIGSDLVETINNIFLGGEFRGIHEDSNYINFVQKGDKKDINKRPKGLALS
jgi:hypothetical protein